MQRYRSAVLLSFAVVAALALLRLLPPENAALSGGAIAVLTLAVNQGFEVARRKSEERRWHAQQFLKDKIESLRKLYATMVDWSRTLNYYGNFPPKTHEELQTKVVVKEEAFHDALAFAAMYLSVEGDTRVREAMGVFRMAQLSLFYALPDSEFSARRPRPPEGLREFPWEKFVQAQGTASAVLGPLLNPRSLRSLETSLEID